VAAAQVNLCALTTETDQMYTTNTNRALTDAELDEANGGEGNVANACIHVAMQYIQDHTNKAVPGTFGFDLTKELMGCK
jgi:hypothetical protein